MTLWQEALEDNPLIAILRGLEPSRALDVADVLVDVGFRIIEVPLNSPSPLVSIETIGKKHGTHAIVGAGTVLDKDDVSRVAEAGGKIIVSPNMNVAVGQRALELGIHWCPGVMTPTEAFAALDLGAAMLKFFPAELIPPKAIAAMRAVLPRQAMVAAVGGITPDGMKPYLDAGANGFGLGSALFKPEYALDEIAKRAKAFVLAYRELKTA